MRRRRLALVLAVLPLFACTRADFSPRPVGTAYLPGGSADLLVQEAATQLAMGNPALAIGTFRRALRQARGDPRAYVGLAACYEQLGRLDLAQRYYREGLMEAADRGREQIATSYAAFLARHGIDLSALDTTPTGMTPAPASGAPDATLAVASVTIELAPLPDEPSPRLERVSEGEVALVTREQQAPVRPAPVRRATATGDPPLRVLNAVGRRGQAARMERHLRTIGWVQVSVGDTPARRVRSIITTPAASADMARRLSAALPFRPQVSVSPAARRLLLVLGRDAISFDQRLQARTTPQGIVLARQPGEAT
jgi:hypothetical protein